MVADTLNTIQSNTKKLLKMGADELMDELHFYRQTEKLEKSAYDNKPNGFKPGQTVSVHIPTHWTSQEDDFDLSGNFQGAKERTVNMTLNKSESLGFDLDTNQLATDIDVEEVYRRLIQPAIYDLAANAEYRMIKEATQYVGNLVGTAGSTIVDPDTVLAGREKMNKFLTPKKGGERSFLMDATAMRSAVNANKNLFIFERGEAVDGYLGKLWGMEWYENELLYNHTNGNDVSCAVESTVVTIATGMTTLGVDGLTTSTGTFTKGTVFTIDNVYAVHPQTKQSLGFLKQFTHVGDTQTANGSGQVTLTLNEPIYSSASGSLQNVDALPADEATINVVGSASTSYLQSLQWHKRAFRVATVPLYMPPRQSVVLAEQVSEQGINLALLQYFDGDTRTLKTRLDMLWGLVAVRPTHACRVTA